MKLPTKEECFHMLKEYHVPAHIMRHNLAVNRVAVLLAEKLREKGIDVNIGLVDRASLLHDMLRLICLTDEQFALFSKKLDKDSREFWVKMRQKYKGVSHEEAVYLELKHKYPKVAAVLRFHGYRIMAEPKNLKNWEEKIVNYADKRVMHDKIVSLAERFKEGHARNVENEDTLPLPPGEIDKNIFELEKQIFKNLDINPEEIKQLVEKQK